MSQTILNIDKLLCQLAGKTIVKDFSLEMHPGELIGMVGPAGCGKTTILKIIAGLITDYQGICQLDLPKDRALIGMSFQNNALFDFLNVEENIGFPLKNRRLATKEEIAQRVTTILNQVGLSASRTLFPKELSGGMQRRVGIARAMITNPALILLDDPTAGLDPATSSKIFALITDFVIKQNTAALVVSSDVDLLCNWTKRLIVMNEGQKVYDGPSKEAATCNQSWVRHFITGF